MKIVLINHTFQERFTYRRWQLFAEQHPDVEVILFAPEKYTWFSDKGYSFGHSQEKIGEAVNEKNFQIKLFRVKKSRFNGWTSPDFKSLLIETNPDIIYHIGTHRMKSLNQILKLRNRYLQNAKVIAFSMRGPAFNLKLDFSSKNPIKQAFEIVSYIKEKLNLIFFNNNCDAVFCHYPDAVKCFREEGYKGPIYMQTQVGVNTEWFYPDNKYRQEIRKKYNISESSFVFGSATRITSDKGLFEILNALPKEGDWKYLMMGAGSQEYEIEIKNLIKKRGISDKVIMTGMIAEFDMPKYWNAVDCALHVPRTTQKWEETFSIALVQAMATRKPVIGSDSGSVPYQIGFDEMIVPEGDVCALNSKIIWALSHRDELAEFGTKMYERTLKSFSVSHLNDMFYDTLVYDIIPGHFDERKSDMANYLIINDKNEKGQDIK